MSARPAFWRWLLAVAFSAYCLAQYAGCGGGPRRCADETTHAWGGGKSPGGEPACGERR